MIIGTCACGKAFQVPDHFAGKRGRCKACGEVVTIPAVVVDDQVDAWLSEPVPAPDVLADDAPAPTPIAVVTPPPIPPTFVAAPAVSTNSPPDSEQLLGRVRQLERSLRRHRIVSAILIASWVLVIGAVFSLVMIARLMYPDPLKTDPLEEPAAASQTDDEARLGGTIMSASLTAATHKVDGTGGARWLSRLTRDEWEALVLVKLRTAALRRSAECLVYEGFADELPGLVALLEQDVRTPSAMKAALGLRRIILRAKRGIKPFQTMPAEDRWVDGDSQAGDRVCEEVGRELGASEQELDRDLDVYFARRWGR